MLKKKILCVDDNRDELIGGRSLEDILNSVYENSYDLIWAENGDDAEKAVLEDIKNNHKLGRPPEIRLVLMDYEFRDKSGDLAGPQGDEIAQKLYELNQDLKFVLLTHINKGGHLISFGDAGAKLAYILKPELDKKGRFLGNLSRAIIEDYKNNNWQFNWDGAGVLQIWNPTLGFRQKDVSLGGHCMNLLNIGLRNPNRSIENGVFEQEMGTVNQGTALPKAFKRINDALKEATDGLIWGILTRERRAEITTVVPENNIVFSASSVAKGASPLAIPAAPSGPAVAPAAPHAISDVLKAMDARLKACEEKVDKLLKIVKGSKKK